MHHSEGSVSAALPRSVPAPRLLSSDVDGLWVALAIDDVDGRPPRPAAPPTPTS